MRRLHIDQLVTVSLDGVPEPIACRVLEVHGTASRLAHGELPPRAVGRLVVGSPGYLLFDQFRLSVGLRVAMRAVPPYLDAAVIDGIALPERRSDERVKLDTRVRIISPDEREAERPPQWTHTLDISEQGALLRAHRALGRDRRLGLELMFGEDPDPIRADASVVRQAADAVAVVFESVAPDDATRLGEYLAGIRHQLRVVEALHAPRPNSGPVS